VDKSKNGGVAATSLPEDIVDYAAGYLGLGIGHYDSLLTRIGDKSMSSNSARLPAVGKLERQLCIQAAIVESATGILDEMLLCDMARGPSWDQARIDSHRLQLLDEIRGLADRSVPA